MRRRLWWELYVLDIRASEDTGTLPIIYEGSYNTRRPANINDEEFNAQSQEIHSREGWTDTTFGIIIFEISLVVKKISYAAASGVILDSHHKQDLADEIQSLIERKYLVYCDRNIPFQCFAATCIKIWFSRMQLIVQFPIQPSIQPRLAAAPNNDVTFCNAIDAVETSYLLETSPDAARWYWCSKSWTSWHAFAIMLAELCTRTHTCALTDRAWAVASLVYEPWSRRVADAHLGLLWRPIKKLYEKASQAKKRGPWEGSTFQQGLETSPINLGDYSDSLYPMVFDQQIYPVDIFPGPNQILHDGTDLLVNNYAVSALGGLYNSHSSEKPDTFDYNNEVGFNQQLDLPCLDQWPGVVRRGPAGNSG